MIKTFTPDDLLRYHYHDTSDEESKEIEIALLTDERLQHEWEQMQLDLQMFDSLLLEPSNAVTNRIMDWAGVMNMAALQS